MSVDERFPAHLYSKHSLQFFDMLVRFNGRHGVQLTAPPTVSKQPIDLHRLYLAVQEQGGFEQVRAAFSRALTKCCLFVVSAAQLTRTPLH